MSFFGRIGSLIDRGIARVGKAVVDVLGSIITSGMNAADIFLQDMIGVEDFAVEEAPRVENRDEEKDESERAFPSRANAADVFLQENRDEEKDESERSINDLGGLADPIRNQVQLLEYRQRIRDLESQRLRTISVMDGYVSGQSVLTEAEEAEITRRVRNYCIVQRSLVITTRHLRTNKLSYRTLKYGSSTFESDFKVFMEAFLLGTEIVLEFAMESIGPVWTESEEYVEIVSIMNPTETTAAMIRNTNDRIAAIDRAIASIDPTDVNTNIALRSERARLEAAIMVRRSGSFFPYRVPTHLYEESFRNKQIYSVDDNEDKIDYTHCFLFSLLTLGLVDRDMLTRLIHSNFFNSDCVELRVDRIKDIIIKMDVEYLDIILVNPNASGHRFYEVRRYRKGVRRAERLAIKDVNWSLAIAQIKIDKEVGHFFAAGNREELDSVMTMVRDRLNQLIRINGQSEMRDKIQDMREIDDEESLFAEYDSLQAEMLNEDLKFGHDLLNPRSKLHDFEAPLMFSADTETTVVNENGQATHRVTKAGFTPMNINGTWSIYGKKRVEYSGSNACIKTVSLLMEIQKKYKRNIQLWFANTKYDLSIFLQDVKFDDICKQGSTVYSASKNNFIFAPQFTSDQLLLKREIMTIESAKLRHTKADDLMRSVYKNKLRWVRTKFTIEFRDLLKIHPESLDKVAESLKCGSKQKGINYSWHSMENVLNRTKVCTIEEYLSSMRGNIDGSYEMKYSELQNSKYFIKPDTFNSFLRSNDEDFNTIQQVLDDEMFARGLMVISSKYREGFLKASEMFNDYFTNDLEVLARCCEKTDLAMREMSEDKICLSDVRTAAGFSYELLKKKLSGIHHPTGIYRNYISKYNFGGRVIAVDRYRNRVLKGRIAPIDATSLYPAAMIRCGKDCGGFPAGIGRPFRADEFESILNTPNYFLVRCRIKIVGRRMTMPIIRTEKIVKNIKKIVYTDDIEQLRDDVFHLDRIGYEDWIKHQQVEMEVMGGLVYENGFVGLEFCELINKLCDMKTEYKRNGNRAMEKLCKLIVNTIYGKTGQKSVNKRSSIINNDEILKKISSLQDIISIEEISNLQSLMNRHSVEDDTQMPNIISVMVLSMSKRIMNELIGIICNDLGEEHPGIYYTDTDSIHMDVDLIEPLRKRYRELYGTEVMGDTVGKFHLDYESSITDNLAVTDVQILKFKPENINDREWIEKNMVVCNLAMYCGSKCYLEIFEGLCRKTGKIRREVVKKLKGVSAVGLEAVIAKYDGEEYEKYLKLYQDFTVGVKIVLNPEGYDKPSFAYQNIGKVYSRAPGSFTRTIKYEKNIEKRGRLNIHRE